MFGWPVNGLNVVASSADAPVATSPEASVQESPGSPSSFSAGGIVGATLSSVVAVGILALGGILLYIQRKRDQNDRQAKRRLGEVGSTGVKYTPLPAATELDHLANQQPVELPLEQHAQELPAGSSRQ